MSGLGESSTGGDKSRKARTASDDNGLGANPLTAPYEAGLPVEGPTYFPALTASLERAVRFPVPL